MAARPERPSRTFESLTVFDESRREQIIQIASQYGRMVECAIVKGNHRMARSVIDQAFEALESTRYRMAETDRLAGLFDIRIANLLESYGIMTIGDICKCTKEYLVSLHGLRKRSVDLIEARIVKEGYRLKQI